MSEHLTVNLAMEQLVRNYPKMFAKLFAAYEAAPDDLPDAEHLGKIESWFNNTYLVAMLIGCHTNLAPVHFLLQETAPAHSVAKYNHQTLRHVHAVCSTTVERIKRSGMLV